MRGASWSIDHRCASGSSRRMTNLFVRRSQGGDGRFEATIAGVVLILVAISAVAMVWTRFQANFDHETIEATLRAIDENAGMFSWHGTARILFGGLLVVSAYFINPAVAHARAIGLSISRLVLVLSGIAMIASGVLTVTLSGLAEFNDGFGTTYQESIYYYRGIAGNISNTLLGLAVFTMAPTQWKFGGSMKPAAALGDSAWSADVVDLVGCRLYFAFRFWDRLILWLLLTSVALFIGKRDGGTSEESTRHVQVGDVN